MRVTILSGLFPAEIEQEIVKNSKGPIQNAANNLQYSIIEGLSHWCSEIKVLNFPFVGEYPLSFKKPWVSESHFTEEKESEQGKCLIECFSAKTPTLLIYKHLSIENLAYNSLKNILNENNGNNTVIIYSIYPPFLKACKRLKREGHKFNVLVIAPDLPQFMGESRWKLRREYMKHTEKNREKSLAELLSATVDGYAIITEAMRHKLPIKNLPWTILEGIARQHNRPARKQKKDSAFRILYSGTLDPKYGILLLLDAFAKTNNPDYRLLICGEGAVKNQILECKDKRVVYLGQLPHDDILRLQTEADLLVNPRTSQGEYTKYSFPSKTLEYLSSGTPALMFNLPGIPDEYKPFYYSPIEENAEELAKEINRIFSLPIAERENMARNAKSFIETHKNPEAQTKRIFELIKKMNQSNK